MSKSKQRGFTIIEVALVLAVAALIFLVVFLAVPALQRNQRNDARRRDIAFVVQAVSSYTSNHNRLPTGNVDVENNTATTGWASHLIDGLSTNTQHVNVVAAAQALTVPARGTINIVPGYTCGGAPGADPVPIPGGSSRSAAIIGVIETGRTTNERYCQSV